MPHVGWIAAAQHAHRRCRLLPPPVPAAAGAAPRFSLSASRPLPQLLTTDRQLTQHAAAELLGVIQAWLRGEAYCGPHRAPAVCQGLADLVGNTPLVRLRSLSEQTGCEVGWRRATCARRCW